MLVEWVAIERRQPWCHHARTRAAMYQAMPSVKINDPVIFVPTSLRPMIVTIPAAPQSADVP